MTAELPIIIAFPGDPDTLGQFLLGQTAADSFCLNVRVSHLHFIHLLPLRVLRNSLLLLYSQFAHLSSRIHIKIHTKCTGSFCAKYTFVRFFRLFHRLPAWQIHRTNPAEYELPEEKTERIRVDNAGGCKGGGRVTIGWLILALCTLGLVLIIPMIMHKGRKTVRYAVCQNCGKRWKL